MVKYLVWVLLFQVLLQSAGIPAINYYRMGNRLYQAGQYRQAEENYRKIFKNKELEPIAYYNSGNAAYQRQDYARAINYYQKALVLNSADEDAWYNLHLAQQQLSRQTANALPAATGLSRPQPASLPPRRSDHPQSSPVFSAGEQLLLQAKEKEARFKMFYQPRAGQEIEKVFNRDIFTQTPEELLHLMRKEMEEQYSRPILKEPPRAEPVPDEIDW